jgi:anti-anti-sigma factor
VTPTSSSSDTPLRLRIESEDGVQVVRFQDAKILSERAVSAMGDQLLRCIEEVEGPPRMVICFEGVTFLSSMGVGKLVTIYRKIRDRGGDLRLCNIPPTVFEVFRVAHLQDYFPMAPDLKSALSALNERPS